ncbi:amino acid adenylation domain-containing protein [Lentzea sp. NPDC034063]|uniref:amino acid adenylation domain-containing protein n=1 Tax=Lentzea sp. NPDC034063 TaxID=3154912 RepID=UPI003409FF6D
MKRLTAGPGARAVHVLANVDTSVPFPSDSSVKELFEHRVRQNGAATALVHGERRMTYAQLNTSANRLADHLLHRGVQPGEVVGVCVRRSCELVVTLLAIIKCGAVYLPFDPSWPDARLHTMFGIAGCARVVTDQPDVLTPRLPRCQVVATSSSDGDGTVNPALAVLPEDIAYINFTSGSTGRPKGVPIQHRSVVRLVHDARYARLDERTVTLLLAPVTFDAATFEIWGALLNGGTCVLYPGGFVRLSELGRVVRRHSVSTVFLTTALFNTMVDEDIDALSSVDTILTGGEAHSLPHIEKALAHYGTGRLVSVYGPTECTTFATYYPLTGPQPADRPLPIGRPIQNTRVHVVRDGRLCEPGETGELCLSGPGLSPGYAGMPEATARRFVDYVVDGVPERLYHTGDLVYLQTDGVLVFQGRDDDQVKINGHRIELGEVRHVLAGHPEVRQAFVTVHVTGTGERVLMAFVVSDGTSETLRNHLAHRLPPYMIPAVIEIRESLPLSTHGKVDRQALLSSLRPVS